MEAVRVLLCVTTVALGVAAALSRQMTEGRMRTSLL